MRSALALPALLLLLLLLPLPSLSENGTVATTTAKLGTGIEPDKGAPASASPSSTQVASDPAQQDKTASKAPTSPGTTTSSTGDSKNGKDSGQSTIAAPAAAPTNPRPADSQDGSQSDHSVTTSVITTKDGGQTATQTPKTVKATSAPPISSGTTSTGSQHVTLGSATPDASGSSPKGPSKMTTASMSPGAPTTGHVPPQGTVTTSVQSVTLPKDDQISSKMPAITGTAPSATWTSPSAHGTSPSASGMPASATGMPASATGMPASATGMSPSATGTPLPDTAQQPSLGPVVTPPARATSPSTPSAPSPSQGTYIPPPTATSESYKIKCEPPEKVNETMLILNFTKTSFCAGGPLDDKLVTLLCRAAKANFNPRQDQCHIRLAPVPDTQAVAVEEITIQTKHHSKDLYESLKAKWDDLKEVGVTNIKLGDQGPPDGAEDRFSMPLIITIVCMASFLLLVTALYGCCHQRLSHRKDQQRLTEELQTVENGYHDNPTLEVMETSSEMQEKKVVNLNGELGDSWIVPLDNLMKDDLDEEEDTHL